MLSRLIAAARRMLAAVTGAAVHLLGWWRRKAWPAHVERVAENPAYAAAAVAVLAGMLGLLPPREAVAAALTAVIGVVLRLRPLHGDPLEGQGRPDGW